MDILALLILGLIVGFCAGKLMKGSGFGVIGDIIVGIAGCVVGGWLLGGRIGGPELFWGITVGGIVTGVIGACVLLFVLRLVFKKK